MLIGDFNVRWALVLRAKFAQQVDELLFPFPRGVGNKVLGALIKLVHPPVEALCFTHKLDPPIRA